MRRPSEGPLDRIRLLGVRGATTPDLVAILLSKDEEDVADRETEAGRLLNRFHGIQGFGEVSPQDLAEHSGLARFELLRTTVAMELGRRAAGAGKGPVVEIMGPDDVAEHLKHLRREKQEHFVALFLDAKAGILRTATIHIGTLTMSVVGEREVFREALREGASSLVVAHNHPSGDPTPSPEDLEVTERLVAAGKLLDIPLQDHVILGERRYVSLRQRGLLT